jgi:glycosyltransferase involved in cell wall biosynthesis
MIELTALILTFNEQENIGRTLTALTWIPHVVVLDSFSTDDTLDLAEAARPGVTIIQRRFDSFARQCNYGLSQIQTPWVLSIDADYVLTNEIQAEIRYLTPPASIAGYAAAFRYSVHGRVLRSTLYPERTVLYRRERALYHDEGHAHRVSIDGAVIRLQHRIDHDDRKPLSRWIAEQDRYAKIEATYLLTQPNERLNAQDRLRKRIFFAAPIMFLYLLLGRALILDGWPGWYYVCQRTLAETVLSLRILTVRHSLSDESRDTVVVSRDSR